MMETCSEYEGWSNEELLKEYQKERDLKIKQELVIRYLYIVKSLAVQMRDVYVSFVQIEDVINEGVLAIMKGLDKFDLDKNVKFETYISKRIRGMIIDLARKHDWVPRSMRKMIKRIDMATAELYNTLGRYPTEEELAGYLDISLKKYQEMSAALPMVNIVSLDMVMEENSEKKKTVQIVSSNSSEQPEKQFLVEEEKQLLAEAVKSLNHNEQLVISLYYIEELNMKQIAEVMQVSEPRISQIHSNAIRKLRVYMKRQAG